MFLSWRKSRARRRAVTLRAEAAARPEAVEAGRALVERFPDEAWPPIGAMVAGYRPVRGEIDPLALMETFLCEQARLCLPCVTGPDKPLAFRAWTPGDPLRKAAFGVEEPLENAPEVSPSLVLAPLLAFDEEGRRLGYGGGFYDRTLDALRSRAGVTAVGLAYEAQKSERVPSGPRDQRLDWVVTEQAAYRCQAK